MTPLPSPRWWLCLLPLTLGFGCGSAANDSGGRGGAGGGPSTQVLPTEVPDKPAGDVAGGLEQGPPDLSGPGTGSVKGGIDALCPSGTSTGALPVLLSAGNLHSTASATRARAWLLDGKAPPPDAIRASDIANFYRLPLVDTTPTPAGLDVSVELRPRTIAGSPVKGQYDIFVGVSAESLQVRPPLVLTVLVDTSVPAESLELEKGVVTALGKGMKPGDHVTLVSMDPAQAVVRKDLVDPGPELAALAQGIEPGSAGDFVTAVASAYGYATGDRVSGKDNRVLYISNGAGSASQVDATSIANEARADPPIFFDSAGVGPTAAFHDRLMFQAASSGRGSYTFVADSSDIDRLFGARFDELFGYAKAIGTLTVELPWWLSSLDPVVPAANGSAQPYLAPGGVASWVLHVKACSPDAMGLAAGELLKLSLDYVDPTTGPNTIDLTPDLGVLASAGASPNLDALDAVRAYADALRSGDKTRVGAALTLLAPLASGAADDPFTEMSKLLGAYPGASG